MQKTGCMVKLVVAFYLAIIFAPLISIFASEYGIFDKIVSFVTNDYARITDVDYKAVVIDDEVLGGGKILVTERLTFDIHAGTRNNLYWELWRDLPESDVDGLHVDYEVLSVKQIMDDGTEVPYEESSKLYWDDSDYTDYPYGPGKWFHSEGPYDGYYNYECVLFYVDGLYREEVTFEIQYIMNNASFRYSDVSQLYLTLYSDSSIKHLDSYKAQILVPNQDMPRYGNYLATTYGTKDFKFEFSESDTINPGYHTFLIDLDEEELKFTYDTRYIEFSLLSFNEDTNIFTENAPDNIYSYDVYYDEVMQEIDDFYNIPNLKRKAQNRILVISVVVGSIGILFAFSIDSKIRKKYNFAKPSMTMEYFRDIPSDLDPHFASRLVFLKHKHKDELGDSLSALMMSLARKDYIELVKIDQNRDWTFTNIKIKVLYIEPIIPISAKNFVQVKKNIDTIENSNKSLVDSLVANNGVKPITINSTNDTQYEVRTIAQNNLITNSQPINNTYSTRTISQNNNLTNTVINNVKHNINGKQLEPLTKNEELYFNLITKYTKIPSRNNEISMKDFQDRISYDVDNTDSFITSLENSIVRIGMNENYFYTDKYNEAQEKVKRYANTYAIIGWLVLTIGNIYIFEAGVGFDRGGFYILGILFIIISYFVNRTHKQYALLTLFGENEYAKWRALYNFLNSETLMNEREVIDLVLWEKYLVYATAFGISDKVSKALKIRCPEAMLKQSAVLNNSYYRSNYYRTHSRSFSRTARSASATSRSNRYHGGYYGGGGSYGGGGRGGGGGGGGH